MIKKLIITSSLIAFLICSFFVYRFFVVFNEEMEKFGAPTVFVGEDAKEYIGQFGINISDELTDFYW